MYELLTVIWIMFTTTPKHTHRLFIETPQNTFSPVSHIYSLTIFKTPAAGIILVVCVGVNYENSVDVM